MCIDLKEPFPAQRNSDEQVPGLSDPGSRSRFPSSLSPHLPSHLPLTSENMGSFLAKSTTRVMAGVMILVNSLKASRSTLSPSGMETMGDWPMSSGWREGEGVSRGGRPLPTSEAPCPPGGAPRQLGEEGPPVPGTALSRAQGFSFTLGQRADQSQSSKSANNNNGHHSSRSNVIRIEAIFTES